MDKTAYKPLPKRLSEEWEGWAWVGAVALSLPTFTHNKKHLLSSMLLVSTAFTLLSSFFAHGVPQEAPLFRFSRSTPRSCCLALTIIKHDKVNSPFLAPFLCSPWPTQRAPDHLSRAVGLTKQGPSYSFSTLPRL